MLKLLGFLFIVVPIALVAAGIALAIIGGVASLVTGLIGFLLFKVLPILVVGYLILHFFFPERAREVREEVKGAFGGAKPAR